MTSVFSRERLDKGCEVLCLGQRVDRRMKNRRRGSVVDVKGRDTVTGDAPVVGAHDPDILRLSLISIKSYECDVGTQKLFIDLVGLIFSLLHLSQ